MPPELRTKTGINVGTMRNGDKTNTGFVLKLQAEQKLIPVYRPEIETNIRTVSPRTMTHARVE
jgi:hypothetical protein